MTDVKDRIGLLEVSVTLLALVMAFLSVITSSAPVVAQGQRTSGGIDPLNSSKRMADGKEWTAANLNVNTSPSYCYDDVEQNCRRYGRLYTWESAQRACRSLGDRWRLPTDVEWRELAERYGGLGNDSAEKGKASYDALVSGGTSGFNAVLGGNRGADGKYGRLDAHGFYWTASENDQVSAPFYNFAKGSHALYRQGQGEKPMAISARCVR
jgi:uncharacterized protein (TIGR02145 family)